MSEGGHNMIILDDLKQKVVQDVECQLLFTQAAHHGHLMVLLITQNGFCQGKYARTISLNTKYMVLFWNICDGQQIRKLVQ